MLQTFSKISLMCLALGMAQLVYSSADNTVVAEIDVRSGYEIHDTAPTPDGSSVFFPVYNLGLVYAYSPGDNALQATISVDNAGAAFSGPFAMTVNPAGTIAWLATLSGVFAIDVATKETIIDSDYPIVVGTDPRAIVSNLDGSRLYVANNTSNTVSVINTATKAVVATIAGFSAPYGLAISPDGAYVYVTNYSNDTVGIINTADNSLLGTTIAVGTGPIGIATSADGQYVYVANTVGNTVSIIDVLGSYAVSLVDPNGFDFDIPTDLAISQDGLILYVVNQGNGVDLGFISIVDVALARVIGIVDNSDFTLNLPDALAIIPYSPYLYTATADGYAYQVFTYVTILAPATITGLSQSNVFFTQTDYINTISWTAPTEGTAPTSYNIYRNAGLTDLAGTVLATSPLVFYDHNRIPGVTYTYYVVSVDSGDIESSAISVSVTTKNN